MHVIQVNEAMGLESFLNIRVHGHNWIFSLSDVREIMDPDYDLFASACGVLARLGNKLPISYTNGTRFHLG